MVEHKNTTAARPPAIQSGAKTSAMLLQSAKFTGRTSIHFDTINWLMHRKKTDLQARQPQCSAQQTRFVWHKRDRFANRSHRLEVKVIVNKS